MMNQTAINADFDLRRYAMKPTPAKPRIIIAQVEGSGTAAVGVGVQSTHWPLLIRPALVHEVSKMVMLVF